MVKHIEFFRNNTTDLLNTNDSLEVEVAITKAAIHFYNDIAYGNATPELGYNGLHYTPACHNIAHLPGGICTRKLATLIGGHALPSFAGN